MKSYGGYDLSNPELLLMLQVLLVRRMATGEAITVDGEEVDESSVLRVVAKSTTSKLALICDHLIPLVPEGDRKKYGELFARLLGTPDPK